MQLFTSWDDGSQFDFKIAGLLNKYDLPGIFFIPNNSGLTAKNIIDLEMMGFKIGGHTVTHPENMRYLSPGALDWEIQNNKNFIEELIKKEITDFCHPGGRYDENVIEAVKRAGFKTARTTLINNTDIPADPYQIKTTIHVLPTRWEYNGKYWLDCAIAKFDEAKKKDGYFHVWGHGWEIENFNLWVDLENLFYYINKNL